MSLKQYKDVYSQFLSASISEEMSFRANFFLLIFLDLFFYASTIFTADFIFDHVARIGPWNRDQLLFFISFMLIIDAIHMATVSTNFWRLGDDLKNGNLDFTFLKPISSIFIVFFRYIRPTAFLSFFVAVGLLVYFGLRLELKLSNWAIIPFLIILSTSLKMLIEFCISTLMFWTTEGLGINFLRMQFQQLSRWPHFVYSQMPRRILMFVVPVLLIGSAPVTFIYSFAAWKLMGTLVLAIIIFYFLLQYLWKKAGILYESASS